MTDLLRDTLTERADRTEPPALDLDGIVSAGDRRIRRRRTSSVVGAAVVTLAVIAGGITALRITRDEPEPAVVPAVAFTERRPTYALNGVIHFGDTTIKTGASPILQLVQTDVGFVYAEENGAIRLTDGKTARTLAEHRSGARLLADGDLAGWTEPVGSGFRTIVQNVRTGDEIIRVDHQNGKTSSALPGDPDLGEMLALDGHFAYFAVTGGLYQVDLDAGTGRRIDASNQDIEPVTVAAGRYIYLSKGPEGVGRYIFLGPSLDQSEGQALHRFSDIRPRTDISPDGSSIAVGDDTGQLAGIRNLTLYDGVGRPYPGVSPVTRDQVFGQWLDDATFTTIPYKGPQQPLDLLTCTLTDAGTNITCKTTFPAIAPGTAVQSFAVPDGRSPKER